MIHKEQVARRFGKMSSSYDDYARVQKHMAHNLIQQAKLAGKFERILEIGCGTGYLTRLLAEAFPTAHILATDIAAGMVATTGKNLFAYSNIRYALEDGEALKTKGPFDLIISNAAFQWFNDYPKALLGFYERLSPGGALVYSTFGEKTFCELHASFQAGRTQLGIDSDARHGQTFVSADYLDNIMKQLGFAHTTLINDEYREYFSTVKEFLVSVKKVGANNASPTDKMLASRQLMFAMMRHYESTFSEDEQVYATYHAIYGFGRK